MCEISARLTSERERLCLTQAAVAELCGVSRAMWGRYENGKAAMGSDVLALFAAAGADAAYILTGVRGAPSQLTAEEERLLSDYRRCSEDARRGVDLVVQHLAQSGAKKA